MSFQGDIHNQVKIWEELILRNRLLSRKPLLLFYQLVKASFPPHRMVWTHNRRDSHEHWLFESASHLGQCISDTLESPLLSHFISPYTGFSWKTSNGLVLKTTKALETQAGRDSGSAAVQPEVLRQFSNHLRGMVLLSFPVTHRLGSCSLCHLTCYIGDVLAQYVYC